MVYYWFYEIEPCEPTCTVDQAIYKGIFVRHLAYLIPYPTDTTHIQNYRSFLKKNAETVWTFQQCEVDGLYGFIWNNQSSNSCESLRNTSASNWKFLGLGNCINYCRIRSLSDLHQGSRVNRSKTTEQCYYDSVNVIFLSIISYTPK